MYQTMVSVARAEAIEDSRKVESAVRLGVELAGGLAGVVSQGALVLIKPNLVGVPSSISAGACTSASVCKALADIVLEVGGQPVIAESSARGVDTERVMEVMGYDSLREDGYEKLST
jgi:uncharacterized protein (DUF362 family)